MKADEVHSSYMKEALSLAAQARDTGDWAIGAIVVLDGKVIAKGRNRVYSSRNRLMHAEMDVLEQLQVDYFERDAQKDMVLYTTFEPCPMCFGAIMIAGIRQVVAGVNLDNSGASSYLHALPQFFKRPHFETTLTCGVLPGECAAMWLSGKPAQDLVDRGLVNLADSVEESIKSGKVVYTTPTTEV